MHHPHSTQSTSTYQPDLFVSSRTAPKHSVWMCLHRTYPRAYVYVCTLAHTYTHNMYRSIFVLPAGVNDKRDYGTAFNSNGAPLTLFPKTIRDVPQIIIDERDYYLLPAIRCMYTLLLHIHHDAGANGDVKNRETIGMVRGRGASILTPI